MHTPLLLHLILFLLLAGAGCATDPATDTDAESEAQLFTLVQPEESGLSFTNQLVEGPNTNILMYEYFYNGGGVAAADFNLDGFTDLYFTSNMGENRLYLNGGDMKFKDVTEASNTAGRPGPWKTGVSVVDINADGRPDLYVSYSGMLPAAKRQNQLFLNTGTDPNGIPSFREAAAEYGLNAPSFTNQAYFFDYDGDGDLDALMLNHNPKSLPILNVEKTQQLLQIPDPERGLRLYRNEEGTYHDVTERAGLNGSPLSYGLGLALSDINQDGHPDFYLSNDYEVPDYLYINNGDGTFTNELQDRLGHTSHFSMGNDIADVNNDGEPDIFTLDMLPQDNRRRKLLMADDNRSRHDLNRASGFPEQTMRNMLQLNRGNGTFAEVGQLAGVAATDWSWSALLVDLNNDGFKDLHVTNGYVRDYTNMDFIKYMDDFVQQRGRLQRSDVLELLKEMPASDVSNYAFENAGGYTFTDQTAAWGLQRASNSNGAVAADLDNDGDLDLVVNNLNQPAFLYRNDGTAAHYLQVKLVGSEPNPGGVGTVVTLHFDSLTQRQEFFPNRGYLSSGPERLHFGLGKMTQVPRLTVEWPGGRVQTLTDVPADQLLRLNYQDAVPGPLPSSKAPTAMLESIPAPISYRDEQENFRDFDRQPLLFRQLSTTGPQMVTGDINGDGRADLILGSSGSQGLTIAKQGTDGSFTTTVLPLPPTNNDYRVTALTLLDANGDDYPDLYVGRGGYHALLPNSPELEDLILYNDGNGGFEKVVKLSGLQAATSTVAASPGPDGSVVFVGGGTSPGRYPEASPSYLLRLPEGGGESENMDITELPSMGMVMDAEWHDLNGDGAQELIVVGNWMPIRIFRLTGADLQDVTQEFLPPNLTGWWNTLAIGDLNGDNRPDLVVGNEGENNLFGVSPESPAVLLAADQDGNGSIDPIFSYSIDGTRYPDLTRDELVSQLARQRSAYPDYRSYASVTSRQLEEGMDAQPFLELQAERLSTSLLVQGPDGRFTLKPLPREAQFSPVHAIVLDDLNADGHPDLLLAGNEVRNRLRYGSSDANSGTLLVNDGKANFSVVPASRSGVHLLGAVRSAARIDNIIIFGITGAKLVAYQLPEEVL